MRKSCKKHVHQNPHLFQSLSVYRRFPTKTKYGPSILPEYGPLFATPKMILLDDKKQEIFKEMELFPLNKSRKMERNETGYSSNAFKK